MNHSDEFELRRSTQARAPLLIGIGLAALLLIHPARSLAQTAQPEDLTPSFAEGLWSGAFAANGPYSVGPSTGTGAYGGGFVVTSITGQLSGTYYLNGTSTATSPQSEATGDVMIDGIMTGSSDLPVMEGQSGTAHVTGTAAGFPIDEMITLGPGDFTEMRITLISATCTEVTGDFTTAANGVIQTGGGSSNLTGSFVAMRMQDITVDDPDLYFQQIQLFLQEVEELKNDILNGDPAVTTYLKYMTDRANELAVGIQRNDACGLTKNGNYIMLIQQAIADLILFAVDHPEAINGYDLYYLTSSAIASGLIGSGSPNPGLSASLKQQLIDTMNTRLDDPGVSCIDIGNIAASAYLLNDSALQAKADQASSTCGGNS